MRVDLFQYFDKDSIIIGFNGKTKRGILSSLLDQLISVGKVDSNNKREILKALVEREKMGSTAIGGGIAIPHARLDCIKKFVVGVAISREGVDFDSLDEEPVCVLVLLLSQQKEAGLHLKMLAFMARVLRDRVIVEQIKKMKVEAEVLCLLKRQLSLVR